MDPSQKNAFGRTAVQVTAMGYGAAPIGNIFRPISEQESQNMIRRAWDNGLRYFDTAPLYGHGLSEARIGHGLRWYPRDEYVLSTKVGRLLKPKNVAKLIPGCGSTRCRLRRSLITPIRQRCDPSKTVCSAWRWSISISRLFTTAIFILTGINSRTTFVRRWTAHGARWRSCAMKA